MILKVFVAESGSLVRLRCDLPKDFWQHSSPSNDIIWKKKSPKDLIFHNNDSNGNTKAPKWKTAPYNNAAASSASSAGYGITGYWSFKTRDTKLERFLQKNQ